MGDDEVTRLAIKQLISEGERFRRKRDITFTETTRLKPNLKYLKNTLNNVMSSNIRKDVLRKSKAEKKMRRLENHPMNSDYRIILQNIKPSVKVTTSPKRVCIDNDPLPSSQSEFRNPKRTKSDEYLTSCTVHNEHDHSQNSFGDKLAPNDMNQKLRKRKKTCQASVAFYKSNRRHVS